MHARLRLRHVCLLGLGAVLLGCSAGSAEEKGDSSDAADTGGEVAALETEAVVYVLTSPGRGDATLWIRRRGEAPVLIDSVTGEHPTDVCMNPDGTGYVIWEAHSEVYEDPSHRTQTIAVGEDWVAAQGERPFPPGYNAVGCPLAWSPEAFIVNLTSETAYSPGGQPPDSLPYRVSARGDELMAEPVEGARAPWQREGPFVLERHPDPETPNRDSEIVLWRGGVDPSPQVTWSAEQGVAGEVVGPWWQLSRFGDPEREGASVSVVPLDDPERDPLVVLETKDPEVLEIGASFSASGEYVAVTQVFEDAPTHIEVVRLLGNAISQRRIVVAPPDDLEGVGWVSVADTGDILFNTSEPSRVYVVPFDGVARAIAPTDLDPEHATVWGQWVEEINSVFVETRNNAVRTSRLHAMVDDGVTPVVTGEGCDARSVDGHEAIFACPDDSFELADLSTPAPSANSLDGLAPAPSARADASFPFEWAGSAWYDLVFTNEHGTGYLRVLYQADTGETMALGGAGEHMSRWAFLPARTD